MVNAFAVYKQWLRGDSFCVERLSVTVVSLIIYNRPVIIISFSTKNLEFHKSQIS